MIQNADTQVSVTGSHLVIENLVVRSDPTILDATCENQPAGKRYGFRFREGASYDVLRRSRAQELYFGVAVERGAHHVRVLDNQLVNNDMKDDWPPSDAGAGGVLLMGDDNEVARNDVSGSDACSVFYGRDGSAVDIYGGQRNVVHHNVGRQNHGFVELGHPRAVDNVIAYNEVTSTLPFTTFLVTRGARDLRYGPVYGTTAYNNSVYLSGERGSGVMCIAGCTPEVLRFANNIVWAEGVLGRTPDVSFDFGHNIYWQTSASPPVVPFPVDATSMVVDPGYVDVAHLDLHLAAGSPAIDGADGSALAAGFLEDLDGALLPSGLAPDIGAFERLG
jgi:hypothetical protein